MEYKKASASGNTIGGFSLAPPLELQSITFLRYLHSMLPIYCIKLR